MEQDVCGMFPKSTEGVPRYMLFFEAGSGWNVGRGGRPRQQKGKKFLIGGLARSDHRAEIHKILSSDGWRQ